MSERITLYLLEDHEIVRHGLRALLLGEEGIHLVGECGLGEQAIEEISALQPTIYLCDIGLPDLSGLEVIQRLSRLGCPSAAIALSMYGDPHWRQRARAAGARGYLVKGAGLSDLLEAIQVVAQGGTFFTEQGTKTHPLSPREEEVLCLVATGHTNKEMSALLSISPRTAEKHRARLMEKLMINDTAGLTRYAIRVGLIDPNLK